MTYGQWLDEVERLAAEAQPALVLEVDDDTYHDWWSAGLAPEQVVEAAAAVAAYKKQEVTYGPQA